MKLIVAVVNKDDSSELTVRLNKAGFMSTKLSTTGGFLKAGNVTLLIGVEDENVDPCLKIMEECCSKRSQVVSTTAGNYAEQFFTALPVEITVGGATVFIVDVERFIKM
ncbi:MAG: transcriptional regulator [Ruminococcaceae bacterium]|nr:transcriptional regulator [Oscillospiraceae bacterium]MBR3595362.1 cyclic-di-AMP receptor [Clostridia bacterium]